MQLWLDVDSVFAYLLATPGVVLETTLEGQIKHLGSH